MNTKEFFTALDLIEKEKGIERKIIIEAFEQALVSAYRRNFNEAADVGVKIDEKSSEITIVSKKTVVEEIEDDITQITLKEAKSYKPNPTVGDVIEFEVTPDDFGRIATQTAKQVVRQRLRQAEQDAVLAEMQTRVGELMTGMITKIDDRNVYIDLGKIEGVLPINELTDMRDIKVGSRIRVYLSRIDVRRKSLIAIASKRDPLLIHKLFELEVPEIHDGLIQIVSIARDVGHRAKVCLTSEDKHIDPVGACIGSGGSRIRNIIAGLDGEKIDLIPFSTNPETFIGASLSPAKVHSITINEDTKEASVIVDASQLSLAIGKKGQNVRLAAQLTGWKIDIVIDEALETERAQARSETQTKIKAVEEKEVENMVADAKPAEEKVAEVQETVIDEHFASKLDALAALIDAEQA